VSDLTFDQPYYIEINLTRWDAGRRVIEQLQGRVPGGLRSCVDVACGPGWFSERLAQLGLDVVGIEGREELVAEAGRRVPGAAFQQVDVESEVAMDGLGTFDLVFCFGLLYHIENPFRVVRNLEHITGRVLLLETMVYPSGEPILRFVDEGSYSDQGLTYHAIIPTRLTLAKMLRSAGFAWVAEYTGEIAHADFIETGEQYRRRGLFLAARDPLDLPGFEAMPIVDAPIFDVAKPADGHGRVEDLEARNAALQTTCEERQAVIDRLTEVAQQRLDLIDGLAETAQQRLDLINQLDEACRALQERLASYESRR
jgi:SAM-dependent methyltransferase